MPEVTNSQKPGDIYRLMGAVLADVGAIGKDRQAPAAAGGYRFRGIDDFLNTIHDLFARHGVFIAPEVLKIDREERTTGKGSILIYTLLTVRHRFYAPDGSWVDATTVGEAFDSGDKSANKAMSAALKYALIETFAIPTEDGLKDSEDQDHDVQPRARRDYDEPEPGTRHTPAHPAHGGEITVEALLEAGEQAGLTDGQVLSRGHKLQPKMRTLGDLAQDERAMLMSQIGGGPTSEPATAKPAETEKGDEDFSETTTEHLRHLKKLCRERRLNEGDVLAELLRECGVQSWKNVAPHRFDLYVQRVAAMPAGGATSPLTDEEKAAALEAEKRETAKGEMG